MDGQYLNRFQHWINDAIEENDRFFSEDIDRFLGHIPKEQWALLGFAMCSLTKTQLEYRGLFCPVAVVFTLRATKRRGSVPKSITIDLFRRVIAPPTIYILKGYSKEEFILEETAFVSRISEIDKSSSTISIKGDIFYCEKKFDGSDAFIDRFLLFLL